MKEHRIFTGATRPAMFLGVPLIIGVLSGLATMVLCVTLVNFVSPLLAVAVATAYLVFFMWARYVTKFDEWRLLQVMQRSRMRHRKLKSVKRWGGVTYTPYKINDGRW